MITFAFYFFLFFSIVFLFCSACFLFSIIRTFDYNSYLDNLFILLFICLCGFVLSFSSCLHFYFLLS